MGGKRTGRGRGGHRQHIGNPGCVTQGDRGHYSGPGRYAQQGARSKLPAPSTGHPREPQLQKVPRAGRLATTAPPNTMKPGPARLATPGPLSVSRAAVPHAGAAPQEPGDHPIPPRGVGTSQETTRGSRPLQRRFRRKGSPKDPLVIVQRCKEKKLLLSGAPRTQRRENQRRDRPQGTARPTRTDARSRETSVPFYQAVVSYYTILQVWLRGHVTAKGIFKMTVT